MIRTRLIAANATQALRFEVLWPHKSGVSACVIPEVDEAPATFHIGAFFDNKQLGTSTIFPQQHEAIQAKNPFRLRAMGVSNAAQGMGVGKAMVEAMVQELKNRNVDVLWCDAREVAKAFYLKQGFTVVRGPYDIPQIGPHYQMKLEI